MEQHKRTIARSASWRITATIVTAMWTGIESAILMNIAMTFVHYIHERIWLKVDWGKLDKS
jgi:uncharacterized membrane protein